MFDAPFLFLFVAILTAFAVTHLGIQIRNINFYLMSALAVLYILGEVIQYLEVGPGWIRWHMSDVGWISWFAILITAIATKLQPSIDLLRLLRKVIWIPFLGGTSLELVQLYLMEKNSEKLTQTSVRGDWVDVTIFIIMFGVNLLLLHKVTLKKTQSPA